MAKIAPKLTHSHVRLMGVSFGFSIALCSAILAGSFEARLQGREPDFLAQIRGLRGVSSAQIADRPTQNVNVLPDATMMANEAAQAKAAQLRRQRSLHTAFSQPVVGTAHHQVQASKSL